MSSEVTKRLLKAYIEESPKSAFLSEKFSSPAENFHDTEEVEVDVVRGNEEIAIVIQDLSVPSRSNSADIYTNKNFIPPIFSEDFPVNSFDLIKRVPGQNPFENPIFQLNASRRFMDGMRKVQAKIMRSIELQASQVFTTGIITLTDSNSVALYTLNFLPKATHFPTAGTAWNAGGATIVNDVISLCNVIRDDGKQAPDVMYMGEASFEAMISDTAMQARLDNRRIDVGDINSRKVQVESGGSFQGTLKMGNYTLDVWTYPGRYKDPTSVATLDYLPDAKVVIRSSRGRLDATFGAIPQLVQPESRVLPFLPGDITLDGRGVALSTFAWVTQNGRQLMGEVGSRPLLIPTAIDTFGCISTGV